MKKIFKAICLLIIITIAIGRGVYAEFESGDSTNLSALSSNINTILNNYLNAAGASSLGKQIYLPITSAINSFSDLNKSNLQTIQSKIDGTNLRLNSVCEGGYLANLMYNQSVVVSGIYSQNTTTLDWEEDMLQRLDNDAGIQAEIQTILSGSVSQSLYNIDEKMNVVSGGVSSTVDRLGLLREDLSAYNGNRLEAESDAHAQREALITAINAQGNSIASEMYNIALWQGDNIGFVRQQVEDLDTNTDSRHEEDKNRQEGIFFESTRFLGATITQGFCKSLSGILDGLSGVVNTGLGLLPDYTLSFTWSDDLLSKVLYTINLFIPIDMLTIMVTLWGMWIAFMITKGVWLRLVKVLQ